MVAVQVTKDRKNADIKRKLCGGPKEKEKKSLTRES
jgi:hypothetical protein